MCMWAILPHFKLSHTHGYKRTCTASIREALTALFNFLNFSLPCASPPPASSSLPLLSSREGCSGSIGWRVVLSGSQMFVEEPSQQPLFSHTAGRPKGRALKLSSRKKNLSQMLSAQCCLNIQACSCMQPAGRQAPCN